MGDENPIRTLGDYSKPSHEGYKNTIELPSDNVVPLRCRHHPIGAKGLLIHGTSVGGSKQTPQRFLKLVDHLTLTGDNRERASLVYLISFRVKLAIGLKVFQQDPFTTSPYDTQYCMENPRTSLLSEYASYRTDDAGEYSGILSSPGKTILVTPIIRHGEVTQTLDAGLSKFEADFKRQQEEPEPTLEDEFEDLHLNLPVLEVLAHALIYYAILDKYVESLELGKNGSSFVQGEVPAKMEDPDYSSTLNIGLLEETDHIFGLADGTKSYPVGIVKDVEVHIGKLKLLNDFYIDMKKDPKTPLLVGRGFLATANAVIDYRMAKIAVGVGVTRSVFRVKGADLGEEEAPYWTTLRKRESYKPRLAR
ncbi:MAK10-like protein [Tanacetum coccineum]